MFITKKHLSRRAMLRGAGAAISLPLLDAMIPAGTALAQTAAKPAPRMGFIYFPHGAIIKAWSPAETGSSFTMSPILKPLEPFRSHLTIVSGLRNKGGESSDPHGIMAGTWLSSKWPGRAPEGKVLLRAFFGGARDPRALEKSDAELVSTALDAMRPLIGITGDPLFTRIYRWDNANAQHEVGHLDRIAAIEQDLRSHPGLFVTGSGFRGVGIPDCVADARATARQVSAWLTSSAS